MRDLLKENEGREGASVYINSAVRILHLNDLNGRLFNVMDLNAVKEAVGHFRVSVYKDKK